MASRALKIDPKKAAASQSQAGQPTSIAEEQISARAYELWIERGCPIGSPEVDWYNAEQELRGTSGTATPAA